MYRDGEFTLNIPFKFPEYVVPAGKKIPKHEKILLNVKSGTGIDILWTTSESSFEGDTKHSFVDDYAE